MSTAHLNSTMISEVFICSECAGDVAITVLPGGDLAYECINARCGKTVHADYPECLAIRDELAIELPAPRVLVEA